MRPYYHDSVSSVAIHHEDLDTTGPTNRTYGYGLTGPIRRKRFRSKHGTPGLYIREPRSLLEPTLTVRTKPERAP